MQNAAKLVTRMDHGHGLIDRFLISIPVAETNARTGDPGNRLSSDGSNRDFMRFSQQYMTYTKNDVTYTFDEGARHLLADMNTNFTAEVNAAILDGIMPPKSKKSDLVPRVAMALHVFTEVVQSALNGHELHECSLAIPMDTFQRALAFVEHLESQKDVLCQVKTKQHHRKHTILLLHQSTILPSLPF